MMSESVITNVRGKRVEELPMADERVRWLLQLLEVGRSEMLPILEAEAKKRRRRAGELFAPARGELHQQIDEPISEPI